ncbi:exodeoxyribonuclease V subunit alpha [Marinomonas sp. 2405UD68-3]|uniref:exodeoxyribonuclease V subunit alpha n=1 Tax=Marinomonas sp. 2405UD68-3 TaxID=3391835 RepID=UPI0039C942FD
MTYFNAMTPLSNKSRSISTASQDITDVSSANELIERWRNTGAIRAIDEQWIVSLMRHSKETDTAVLLAGVLCSAYLGMGHVCLYLEDVFHHAFLGSSKEDKQIWKKVLTTEGIDSLQEWGRRVSQSSLVVTTQQESTMDKSRDGQMSIIEKKPLVLEQNRLYLSRYFYYEETVHQFLKKSSQAALLPVDKKWLDDVFSSSIKSTATDHAKESDLNVDWQKVAVASAAAQKFAIISGGPGTGKTTTVIKLLALLVQQANKAQQTLNIKLTAPTGKAAARLTESISKAKVNLPIEQSIKDAIPERASTLHRLLGANFGRSEFKFNSENPLHLDVLLVDEVSMVDLPMMAKLVDALPSHARLILLGDKDQLASVEAGGVLGDLTAGIDDVHFSSDWVHYLSNMLEYDFSSYERPEHTAQWINRHLTLLRKSYRFDGNSGIGLLASAVNRGNENQAMGCLLNAPDQSIQWHPTLKDGLNKQAVDITELGKGYAEYWRGVRSGLSIESLFVLFSRYQVLCAVRQGDFGVESINEALCQYFYSRGYLNLNQTWEAGKAIMIRRNDSSLGLFNGDIGICMPETSNDSVHADKMRVWFQLSDGSIKGILPSRLSDYEWVYAMTVHKSQGSEFDTVVLVLPENTSPVLTKELLYTGITRAKAKFSIWGNEATLRYAITNQVTRLSGLQNKIWSKIE